MYLAVQTFLIPIIHAIFRSPDFPFVRHCSEARMLLQYYSSNKATDRKLATNGIRRDTYVTQVYNERNDKIRKKIDNVLAS